MAELIHTLSPEGVHPSLDLYHLPPTQTSVEKKSTVKIVPVSNNASVITFRFEGSEELIDLSESYFLFHLKLQKGAVNVADADDVGVVNNILDSLISQLQIKVGNETLKQDIKVQAYASYLHHLFSPQDVQETTLKAQGWVKDTPGQMDTIGGTDATPNKGYYARSSAYKSGKEVEIRAKIHHGLCLQDRYILHDVPLEFELTLNPKAFFLMGDATGAFVITKKELHLRTVKISDDIKSAMMTVKSDAKYPFIDMKLITRTFATTTTQIDIGNLYSGVLPSRLIIGMVATKAFQGDVTKNPFNFIHNKMNRIELKLNGYLIPEGGYELDFDNKHYMEPYHNLIEGMGAMEKDKGLITPKEFANGYYLLVYNLRADDLEECFDLQKCGTLSLRITFPDTGLDAETTLLCFMEFQKLLQISSARKVTVI